jgi:SAM-dependent methyltransferase
LKTGDGAACLSRSCGDSALGAQRHPIEVGIMVSLLQQIGVRLPIVQAPMAGTSTPQMAPEACTDPRVKRSRCGGIELPNARTRYGFASASICSFSDPDTFDCVIGRYVLVHQSDPVDFLRTAGRVVRPGGIIAFHEVDFAGGFNSLPRVWRWDAVPGLPQPGSRPATG